MSVGLLSIMLSTCHDVFVDVRTKKGWFPYTRIPVHMMDSAGARIIVLNTSKAVPGEG